MKQKKGLWQLLKFALVSLAAGAIQLGLANVLPLVFDGIRTPIPEALRMFFDPGVLFSSPEEIARYVAGGAVTWGYVLPFLLSNVAANVYGYFQNKATTFHSDAPPVCFVIYFVLLALLILFSTWFQGFLVGAFYRSPAAWLRALARTAAAAAAGTLQMAVLFPLEKFVLLKERK